MSLRCQAEALAKPDDRCVRGGLDAVRREGITAGMVTRTIKLPEALDQRLQRRARAQKVTYSEAARLALQQALQEEAGVNMLECLREFAGSVDGPADLSTNRAYLDDFGSR